VDPLKNISGSIKALRFPEWSVAQKVSERMAFGIPCRARPLVHFNDGCISDWRTYQDDEGKVRPSPFTWCKTRGPNALIRG
jgi:hypothetical protein